MAEIIVYWTQTAIKQRNYIYKYWNKRNGSTRFSMKLNFMIKERINILTKNPELGKITEYNDHRMVSFRHYSIFYKFKSKSIYITGIWDNRQDPVKLLNLLSK